MFKQFRLEKLVMNNEAARLILKSQEVSALLDEHASRIAAAAGDGFRHRPAKPGRTRARAVVGTTDLESLEKNARENTLLKALGGGSVD